MQRRTGGDIDVIENPALVVVMIGHPASRFGDQKHPGCNVPGTKTELPVAIKASSSNPGEVESRRAKPPNTPYFLEHRADDGGVSDSTFPPIIGESRSDHRPAQVGHR